MGENSKEGLFHILELRMFVLYSDVPFNAKKQPIFLEVNCIPLVFPTFNLWTSPCGKSLWIVNVSEISRIVTKDYRYVSEILRIGDVPEIPVLHGGASEVGRQVGPDSSPALHTHRPVLAIKSFAHEDACILFVFKCVLSLI